MISLSFSIVLSLFFIGLKPTGEFTSLEEPAKVSAFAVDVVFLADAPDFIGSERRAEARDPTQKLKLPIIKSISRSKFTKTGARVGGCG
jgi:hypothetical protein